MSDNLSVSSIPHRPPFLFVDEIVEVSRDKISTRKLADPEADFFRGHYPDHPVMPGVLVCESAFQAGALLMAYRASGDGGGDLSEGVPVLTRITDARFKRMVSPGDTLEVEVTFDEELMGAVFLTGRVKVDGKLAVRVSFVCMNAPPPGKES